MRVKPLGSVEGSAPPVRLWPLLHVEPEMPLAATAQQAGATSAGGHAILAWPFIQWHWATVGDAGEQSTSFGLHPIFARSSEAGVGTDARSRSIHTDFLWPFFQWQRKTYRDGTLRTKFQIPPILLRQKRMSPDRTGEVMTRKRLFVFPFWWSGSSKWDEEESPPPSELDRQELAAEPLQKGDAEPAVVPLADDVQSTATPERADSSQTHLLPFVWLNRGEETYLPIWNPFSTQYTMLWPLYGYIPAYGPEGYRWEYWFYVWPLWLPSRSIDDPTQRSLSILWPFLRFQWGGETPKATREIKIWPLFQALWDKEGKYRGYFIWPLVIWRDASTPEEQDRQFAIFPFYLSSDYKQASYRIYPWGTGHYKDDNERVRFVLWPFYLHWIHDDKQFEETQVLWHIIRWRNSTGGDPPNILKQVVLFYRYESTPSGRESWYHPILLWHGTRRQYVDSERGEYTFNGRYSFPFYFHKHRAYQAGGESYTRFVFPFYLHQQQADGSYLTRGLWPLWQESWEGLQRNWTPLWSFWRAEGIALKAPVAPLSTASAEVPDGANAEPTLAAPPSLFRRWSFFGPMYRGESGPNGWRRVQVNVGPLAYDRIGDQRAVSVLGGWFPIVWGAPAEPGS